MARDPLKPLEAGPINVGSSELYHRVCTSAGPAAPAMVHVHGFGISGTYLEPTAVMMAGHARHFIPDLPGTGRSDRPRRPLDIPGSMQALVDTDRIRQLFGGRPGMAAVVIDGAHALNFTHPVTVAALIRAQLDGTELTGELAHDETMEVVFDDR